MRRPARVVTHGVDAEFEPLRAERLLARMSLAEDQDVGQRIGAGGSTVGAGGQTDGSKQVSCLVDLAAAVFASSSTPVMSRIRARIR